MKSLTQTPGIEHSIFSYPLLQRITRPHSSLKEAEIRFKSQLLATMLVCLLLVMAVLQALMMLGLVGKGTTLTGIIVVFILLAQYFLNRAGFYQLSAGLLTLTLIIVLFVLPMAGVMSSGVLLASPLILLLGAIFFPGRFTAWMFALLIVSFLILNTIFPVDDLEQILPSTLRTDALLFFVFQGVFIFVLVYSRNLIESQRSAELLRLNARLEETNQALQSATDTVRQSEAKWRAILANAPVTIAYTQPDGQIEFINNSIGDASEENQRQNIFDLTTPDNAERIRQIVREVIEQKIPANYETMQNVDGQPRWFSTIVGTVEDGQALGLTFITNDITEQRRAIEMHRQLQQQVIDSQKQLLRELSTPVIPILDRVIIMPVIGSIDSSRAQDMTRALLAGISANRARYVVLDVTGVPVVDTGVAQHLNRTIQAARLKGAQTIVTGISDAIAETIVDLGMDWSDIETQRDLQTGLTSVMNRLRESANHDITVN